MGSLSFWHLAIVLVVVLFLFGGRGRIAAIMGDIGAGVGAIKRGVHGETKEPPLDGADDHP